MSAVGTRQLGRFELRRELGRGAQATVWLAYDPRLEREVALKLLNPDTGTDVHEWLEEARAVSRLTHPNIVPVFEADRAGRQAYMVFEYVPGQTLAEAMRQRTSWTPHDAVALMLGVIDALAAAHAQGIVHRDLKPSNILLGPDGRARVMDFGIAARVAGRSDGRIVGTPGYISPEAARGDRPAPAMDVFSTGVVLAEMLSGQRLLRETDPMRALARVQKEDLQMPATGAVDDTLHGIVQRALARDPAKRYERAQALHAALIAWHTPPEEAPAGGDGGHGTLEFLMRRMRLKGDFPALSESVARIQRVASSETESLKSLTEEILKDVALTNKLLRMVNTAHFSAAGGAVSTVSRAVALVGFAGIRNLAVSLLLLEHMRDKEHAAQLKAEFLHALVAGAMGSELSFTPREGEEAFLGAMFQNLGRLLTGYYFPEEAREIRRLLDGGEASHARREAASARVLGIGFEELGVGIAKGWGLPDNLLRVMRPPLGEVPTRKVDTALERQRWVARAANELAEVLLHQVGEAQAEQLRALVDGYAPALGVSARSIGDAVDVARDRIETLAPVMGLSLAPPKPAAVAAAPAAAGAADAPTLVQPRSAAQRGELLSQGIQDVTAAMVSESFRLNDVLARVLATMHGALGVRRVLLCLRDPRTAQLTGRLGVGEGADAVAKAFKVPLVPGAEADLFAAVCAKGLDTLIADAAASNIASRLPAWYRQSVNAPAFLLLPLMLRGAPFGLLYADDAVAGAIVLTEKELALLRTLRNQAVMAFRQSER